MEEKTKSQLLYDHYIETGRTPLNVPLNTTILKVERFKEFLLLLEELPEPQRIREINKAISQIERHISWLSKTDLCGGKQDNIKEDYQEWILTLNQKFISQPITKKLPPLPDCFIDRAYGKELLKDPRVMDCYETLQNGSLKWKHPINELGALARRLLNKGKLINDIQTGPDLAKIFCLFFSMEISEKEFQPGRVEKSKVSHLFDWIK